MATRSSIAKMHEDGKIQVIYCHWDGYLDNNGKLLKNHYNSQEIVDKLLENGDLSSLSNSIETCSFYIRDRNEDRRNCLAKTVDFQEYQEKHCQEYNYLWRDSKWFYSTYDSPNYYVEL